MAIICNPRRIYGLGCGPSRHVEGHCRRAGSRPPSPSPKKSRTSRHGTVTDTKKSIGAGINGLGDISDSWLFMTYLNHVSQANRYFQDGMARGEAVGSIVASTVYILFSLRGQGSWKRRSPAVKQLTGARDADRLTRDTLTRTSNRGERYRTLYYRCNHVLDHVHVARLPRCNLRFACPIQQG